MDISFIVSTLELCHVVKPCDEPLKKVIPSRHIDFVFQGFGGVTIELLNSCLWPGAKWVCLSRDSESRQTHFYSIWSMTCNKPSVPSVC